MSTKDLYRALPSVDEVLRSLHERNGFTPAALKNAARRVLEDLRAEISAGGLDEAALQVRVAALPQEVERAAHRTPTLRRVVNATGVILHTNLGRAPVSTEAIAHLTDIAGGYSNLEFDLESGERGRRDVHVQRPLERLLAGHSYAQPRTSESAPDAIVVNNCAAAVLLALNTLADGGEVIVSRGELVEIGGSFRVPEIMAKSGAQLREVGTTNRTRLSDYEKAITERTRLLLRVHRSNFAIIGFTEQPTAEELVTLGRKHRIPVMEDLGNGLLVNLAAAGIQGEHGLHDSLAAGVDVVCVSGDKLLGGPQSGVITGRKELVKRIRANPLFRALRVDKLTYAALEATLLAYLRQDYSSIPALRMIYIPIQEIRSRAQAFMEHLGPIEDVKIEVIEGKSCTWAVTVLNLAYRCLEVRASPPRSRLLI